MLYRSTLRCALGAATAACALAVLASPALAAPSPPTLPVPADAPTVATTPSGAQVLAFVHGGRTCTVLQRAGAPRPAELVNADATVEDRDYDTVNGVCVHTPSLSQYRAQVVRQDFENDGHRATAWGVAGTGAGRVELRDQGRVVAASPALPAALPGPAGALRFWAVDVPPSAGVDELALFDAAGTLRRAWAPRELGGAALGSDDGRSDPKGTVLQRGHRGNVTWTLRRVARPMLDPTPLEPEHRVDERCLALSVAVEGVGGSVVHGPCDQDDLVFVPLVVQQGDDCSTGLHFEVLARPPIRTAVAILGDGTRRSVRLAALGGELGARGGELMVGKDRAVRRVEGRDARGHVVRSWPVAVPPYTQACDGSFDGGSVSGFTIFPGDDGPLGAGPHVPRVVDRGVQVCVAIDRAPRVPEECTTPPIDPEDATVGSIATAGGGRYLYGLVPLEVAAVRIRFADRSAQTVPRTPIPGYAGRYAGVLGQVALELPAGRRPYKQEVLDDHGRVLASWPLASPETEVGSPHTLLPAAGGLDALRAWDVRLALPFAGVRYTCVGFGERPATDLALDCDLPLDHGTTGAGTVQVDVRCAPRRTIVLAALRHRTDRLVLGLRGGREVTARQVRLPAGTGPAAGNSIAVAILGPRDALTGIRLRGKAARKAAVAYPAAAEQCGYSDEPFGDLR